MREPVQRRLAAILAADVAGYSRLMGADEEGTLALLKAHRGELIDPKVREHRGRIVKLTGDGTLVEFPSVVDAVRCAVEIQRAMVDRNADVPEDKRIAFRIGINLGDIIVDGGDIYGDGVNIAARLEALAEPGGISISRVVRDQIRDKLPYTFQDMGEQSVKNIARPVRAYALSAAAVAALPPVMVAVRPRSTRQRANRRREAPRLSIVVLPFANLSNDPEQEYFADGVTDDLTTDLSRISGSFVIARHTAFTYKGKAVDMKRIGRELGVRYVLEGSVRRTGDQVRVNVQLIDAESGAHIWADRFDTDRRDLAEAQSGITGRLARTLNMELLRDVDRRIEQEREVSPDARDLVMRGWAEWHRPRSLTNNQEAQRTFERALALDPRSVGAKIGLATVLASTLANRWSGSVERDEAQAEQLLLDALAQDPDSSMANFAMGLLRQAQNRLPEAYIATDAALTLDHNNVRAETSISHLLLDMGSPQAGIPYAEHAIRLNPRDPNIALAYMILGRCHLLSGHADQAIEFLRKANAANPWLWHIQFWLAGALGLRGDLDDARAALSQSLKLNPDISSFARLRSALPYVTNPDFLALADKTINLGLRRAGFPEE